MFRSFDSRFSISAVVVILSLAGAQVARADGSVLAPAAVPVDQRELLLLGVASAKTSDPEAFAALSEIRKDLEPFDGSGRTAGGDVWRFLTGLGERALMPMLNEIAIEAAPRGAVGDGSWNAWNVGLIHAVGRLRDPRAEPVLMAIVQSSSAPPRVVEAAATALAKTATDQSAAFLIGLSRQKGPRQLEILKSLGHSRRQDSAERLAEALDSAGTTEMTFRLAEALGTIGSAWAWRTPVVAANGQEALVRSVASRALFDGFLRDSDARSREIVTQALQVVDWRETFDLIEKARSEADPELLAALRQLEARLVENPIHRRFEK
jgi:hypothetical protein